MTSVALAIICHDRAAELADALASTEDDRWDEIVVLDMASEPPLHPIEGVRWIRSDANLGVTAGRNLIVREVTADVVVFLDDDAVALTPVAAVVRARFASDVRLGVLAFRLVRPGGGSVKAEHPFRGRVRAPEVARPCGYFLGGANAIRRSAMVEVGGYDEAFYYSTEEVELAYRLAVAGWTLWYEPTIVIEHRPSTRGRSVLPEVPARRLRNRIVLARRHLPAALAVSHIGIWAGRTALEAARSGSLRLWWRAGVEAVRIELDREPLPWSLLWRMHRRGGRVLW